MTDREYEKMMVEAANGRFKIEAVDAQIKSHQAALDYLNEYRRGLINRYDLNKILMAKESERE
ncbi:TPA: hypothetical protein M8M82_004602 [Salmonella enterica subsp. enterica serovar Dublin]|nr:hypothetical protein [Salmonella enterica subsp. enterica serovar Dublin]HCC8877178.1 hypothetical protein [Salmonella enterica subsp. enterica serovar Dublin]HCC9126666.1 hypothetical protein [Salmonella enterica subsp. enterica serovar Dublin]HCC9316238.1 hypothetical protein [Salmonella enterica subsp. enterica serovar Dublin]HCC9823700.1 hypothetical protein [Salmonella enterica subsp. enterica serovar Dublin]